MPGNSGGEFFQSLELARPAFANPHKSVPPRRDAAKQGLPDCCAPDFSVVAPAYFRDVRNVNGSFGTIIGIAGALAVAAFVGAFFAGFGIAGKSREKNGYVLRGIFWSLLIFFGGLFAIGALAFGACILVIAGLK